MFLDRISAISKMSAQIFPLMLRDEKYALELPLAPYTTMLAFRKGRFILIGDMDWLYLVRTRLEQAA